MSNARGMRRPFHGFTLIEVLVVVAIIALLVAILLPSLAKARDQAKEAVCTSNLSMFGKGFYIYAAANRDSLCSGSFNPGTNATQLSSPSNNGGRDGSVDRIGWIADLVNSRTARPAEILCPTNMAKYNQKLAQVGSNKGPYTDAQATALISRGYNSNYTQAWYMARSEVSDPNEFNMNKVFGKRGPLKTAQMLRVSASRVPILGDGRVSGDTYRKLPTVKTMTDGPYNPPYGLQHYSDFGPAHGFGPPVDMGGGIMMERVRACILFADGHVDKFIDKVRNGQFEVFSTGLPADPEAYTQEDLDVSRVFDGVISLGAAPGVIPNFNNQYKIDSGFKEEIP